MDGIVPSKDDFSPIRIPGVRNMGYAIKSAQHERTSHIHDSPDVSPDVPFLSTFSDIQAHPTSGNSQVNVDPKPSAPRGAPTSEVSMDPKPSAPRGAPTSQAETAAN